MPTEQINRKSAARALWAFAALLLILAMPLGGCGPKRVEQDGKDVVNSTQVERVYFVDPGESGEQEVTQYMRTDGLYARVVLKDSPENTRLLFRWYDKASGDLMYEQEHVTGTDTTVVQANLVMTNGSFPTGTFNLQTWLADLNVMLNETSISVS